MKKNRSKSLVKLFQKKFFSERIFAKDFSIFSNNLFTVQRERWVPLSLPSATQPDELLVSVIPKSNIVMWIKHELLGIAIRKNNVDKNRVGRERTVIGESSACKPISYENSIGVLGIMP